MWNVHTQKFMMIDEHFGNMGFGEVKTYLVPNIMEKA